MQRRARQLGMSIKRMRSDNLENRAIRSPQHGAVRAQLYTSACKEWLTEWADARAILATALLEDVTIVVLNRKELLLERFSPTLNPPFGSRNPWLLEFTGDHFNPVVPPSTEWLQNLALSVPLQPWGKTHG